jgi:hypothetical protein
MTQSVDGSIETISHRVDRLTIRIDDSFDGFRHRYEQAVPVFQSARFESLVERGVDWQTVLEATADNAPLDSDARAFLRRGMDLAMEWAAQGLVVPHIGQTIDSTVEAINEGLESLKAGRGVVGKVAVIVDRDLALAASVHA